MKKVFNNIIKEVVGWLTVFAIIIAILGAIYGWGYINYKLWRAEHPEAKTWVFFLPTSK